MKAEDMILIEMRRLAKSGERVSPELPLQTRAIAAVLDKILAELGRT